MNLSLIFFMRFRYNGWLYAFMDVKFLSDHLYFMDVKFLGDHLCSQLWREYVAHDLSRLNVFERFSLCRKFLKYVKSNVHGVNYEVPFQIINYSVDHTPHYYLFFSLFFFFGFAFFFIVCYSTTY